MRRLRRAIAVAALSLAAGTGLSVAYRSTTVRAPETAGAAPPRRAATDTREDVPLPQERDPSLVPSLSPWPKTNPDASIPRAWMVAEGPYRASGDARRLVTLTFDDGPSPDVTPEVLRLLARHRVRATFFVIGRYLEGDSTRARRARDVLRKVVAAGHFVGNHTYDHANLTSLSHADVVSQIDSGSASIERVTGARPLFFRPPYGRLDELGERAVRERNLDLILWSVEARDMQRGDPSEMLHDLVAQLDYKEGGIILLHDVKRSSVVVLRRLLEYLRDRPYDPARPEKWGYEIVDLPRYLRAVADAPSPHEDGDSLERARGSSRPKRKSSTDHPPGES